MMIWLSKLLRSVSKVYRYLGSFLRVCFYRIAYYPNIQIDRGVHLQPAVRISATDGGFISIGSGTTICSGAAIIAKRGIIEIGTNSYLGQGEYMVAINSIRAGNDALIAERVSIRDQNHGMEIYSELPFRLQTSKSAPIFIGYNVWLGAGTFIGSGVEIQDNVVVGANAVVTRNLASRSVYAGVPATKIRSL